MNQKIHIDMPVSPSSWSPFSEKIQVIGIRFDPEFLVSSNCKPAWCQQCPPNFAQNDMQNDATWSVEKMFRSSFVAPNWCLLTWQKLEFINRGRSTFSEVLVSALFYCEMHLGCAFAWCSNVSVTVTVWFAFLWCVTAYEFPGMRSTLWVCLSSLWG